MVPPHDLSISHVPLPSGCAAHPECNASSVVFIYRTESTAEFLTGVSFGSLKHASSWVLSIESDSKCSKGSRVETRSTDIQNKRQPGPGAFSSNQYKILDKVGNSRAATVLGGQDLPLFQSQQPDKRLQPAGCGPIERTAVPVIRKTWYHGGNPCECHDAR